jgi:hypothetical protein
MYKKLMQEKEEMGDINVGLEKKIRELELGVES